MTLQKYIKENTVLAIGVFAPVIVMIIFFVTSTVIHPARPNHVDIHYDILLQQPDSQPGLQINAMVFVENGTLYVQYTHTTMGTFGNIPKLYLYEAASRKLRQLDFPPPDMHDDSMMGKKILVESTKNFKLDTSTISPDGYSLSYGYENYRQSGIINDLFIGNSGGSNGLGLKKDGVFYPLPIGDIYSSDRLIGWVVGKQG